MSARPDVDTVVLDLDGTLVDSVYQHVCSWQQAFQRVGLHVPGHRIHAAIGMGGDKLVGEVAGQRVEQHVGDEVRSLHDQLFDDGFHQVRALDGADVLLTRLAEAGLTIVLASSSPGHLVDRLLGLVEGQHRIKHRVVGDEASSKPDPDLVERALEAAGSRRGVVIGDAVWDVESAARAGVPGVGLLTGGVGAGELTEAGAIAVLEGPGDLAERLDDVLHPVARD